jgi:Nucleotide modification associated domain 3
VDSRCNRFVYVPIPETKQTRTGLATDYSILIPTLSRFGRSLPSHLDGQRTHLDPDFEHLTYGDQGQRANQLWLRLGAGDFVVFYAALRDIHTCPYLIYAIIGIFFARCLTLARSIPRTGWHRNAHTRRVLTSSAADVVIEADPLTSGRLEACIPIGSLRPSIANPGGRRMYRVASPLLSAWGGLSVSDGYLQRSARLPVFNDPQRFLDWFWNQRPMLIQRNN